MPPTDEQFIEISLQECLEQLTIVASADIWLMTSTPFVATVERMKIIGHIRDGLLRLAGANHVALINLQRFTFQGCTTSEDGGSTVAHWLRFISKTDPAFTHTLTTAITFTP